MYNTIHLQIHSAHTKVKKSPGHNIGIFSEASKIFWYYWVKTSSLRYFRNEE